MMKWTIRLFCLFLSFAVSASETEHDASNQAIRKKLRPFLLPDDHQAKPILDEIFLKSRALASLKSMRRAGFEKTRPRKFTHLLVTRHPALPGYIIKAYLDAQRFPKNRPEYEFWLLRIQGARKIQKKIKKDGLEAIFKVPNQWIYPLPRHPMPSADLPAKHFILVEEDMQLLSKKENLKRWKSPAVTNDFLVYLYHLLDDVGLHDCAKPDNIPFSTDGRIAFVDTQTFDEHPVAYEKLDAFLSPQAKAFWRKLYR